MVIERHKQYHPSLVYMVLERTICASETGMVQDLRASQQRARLMRMSSWPSAGGTNMSMGCSLFALITNRRRKREKKGLRCASQGGKTHTIQRLACTALSNLLSLNRKREEKEQVMMKKEEV